MIYVDANTTGPVDGLTWSTAFTNVQDALTNAAPGDEIWVAEGVYTPTYRTDAGDARTATFVLTNSVALYGGFAATETLRTQRDWQAHVTVLSGDLDSNDITDANGVITNTANIVGNNAYHAVTGSGVTETSRLDGLVITGGNADGDSLYAYDRGGGMFSQYSSPMLTNVAFSGNSGGVGGGIYNSGGSPQLTNVVFSDNSASTSGGGMYNFNSSPTLVDVTFSGNSASIWGGGMYNFDSSPMLTGVIFNGNSSGYYGGGMGNHGGSPWLVNVIFSGNTAGDDGGGMDNSLSSPQLANVTFSGNTASRNGGGMYNYDSSTTLVNCVLWGNEANGSTDQSAQIFFPGPSAITVTYSLVQGGVYTGTGNIDADPQFVRNPDPGLDGTWGTADDDFGDLSLSPPSHAIDAGNNSAIPPGITTDLGGNPRFLEIVAIPDTGVGSPPIVDIGAYEATETDWRWPHQVFVPITLKN